MVGRSHSSEKEDSSRIMKCKLKWWKRVTVIAAAWSLAAVIYMGQDQDLHLERTPIAYKLSHKGDGGDGLLTEKVTELLNGLTREVLRGKSLLSREIEGRDRRPIDDAVYNESITKLVTDDGTTPKMAGYYIITMLSLFNGNTPERYGNFTLNDFNGRDEEYLFTLESNINHNLVMAVHLLYEQIADLQTIDSRNFKNRHKIIPVKWPRKLHMADFFLYASKNLVDKPVIAINGDIIIGEGLDQVDTVRLRDEAVMFSLTRYNKEKNAKTCIPAELRLDKRYIASHDTHIFRLAEPLNETLILDKLNYPINMWGAENAMIWTFRHTLNYTIRNPCRVIKTYHNHCSRVHGPKLQNRRVPNYSIFRLGWTRKQAKAGHALYEDTITYR